MVRISDSIVNRFVVAKKHGDACIRVNSIDFVGDGTTFIAAFNDDSVGIYDLKTGQRDKAQVCLILLFFFLLEMTHFTITFPT